MENAPKTKFWFELSDYFEAGALDVDFPCDARYSQDVHAETFDALIEAVRSYDESEPGNDRPNLDTDDFLGHLWNRGYKVVPRGQ